MENKKVISKTVLVRRWDTEVSCIPLPLVGGGVGVAPRRVFGMNDTLCHPGPSRREVALDVRPSVE